MKHLTNHQHRKYCMQLTEAIQKVEVTTIDEKIQVPEKLNELKNNKETLEEIYASYQLKIKELGHLLDEYEKVQQVSRINLRKLQMWLKYTYGRFVEHL